MNYSSFFQPFIAHSPHVHFLYALESASVVYVSEAYPRVFGRPAALVNEHLPEWRARINADDRAYLQQQLAGAAEEEVVAGIEVRLDHGTERPQWLSLTLCRDGQAYLSGQVQDITREKETASNAQKFNMKKNATLEVMSHDLAAPLVLVQQLADDMSAESAAYQNPVLQQLLDLLRQTCTEGVALIRDFVDNEFFESSLVQLKRERADLVQWTEDVMEEYQRSTPHTHLRFALEVAERPLYVEYDINKFQQVLNNLVSNAIKFTPDGGLITVRVQRQGPWACVQVADTGIGIPEHLHAALFDKFTPARRPGLRGETTTGLGMSLIKTIVDLHQGRIRFESAEEQGTTFYVELPVAPA